MGNEQKLSWSQFGMLPTLFHTNFTFAGNDLVRNIVGEKGSPKRKSVICEIDNHGLFFFYSFGQFERFQSQNSSNLVLLLFI